jgi:hypothetical protein
VNGHDELKAEVEFPDISALVNAGKLNLSDVLKWRKHASKFREWLQDESERDRNAIIAYHKELGRTIGASNAGRAALRLFGVIGGGLAGTLINTLLKSSPDASDPLRDLFLTTVGGSAAGSALEFLFEVATSFQRWKPVVFGDWLSQRIRKLEELK